MRAMVIVTMLVIGVAAPAQDVATGFRSTEGYGETRWGMTKSEVLAAVPNGKDSPAGIYVEGDIAGKPAITLYRLTEDRLTIAGILFTPKYVNKNNYIKDYRELQALLSKKYGPPKKDEMVWSHDLYRKTPTEWGMAVGAGHLIMFTNWETDKTKIELGCKGENFKITRRIRYASKELEHLQKRESEADKLKGL